MRVRPAQLAEGLLDLVHKDQGPRAEVAAELKDLHSEVAKVRAEESNKSE